MEKEIVEENYEKFFKGRIIEQKAILNEEEKAQIFANIKLFNKVYIIGIIDTYDVFLTK